MKKLNKKRKPRKELSIPVILLVILMFPITFLSFGICVGFLATSFIVYSARGILTYSILSLLFGVLCMSLLFILARNSDKENVKPFKWYVNCMLMSLVFVLIITAVTIFTMGSDDSITNYIVGALMFPLIGIITTPNVVRYVKKDTTKWKKIFYQNGNLHTHKNTVDYYRATTPVAFEKEILKEVRKEQLRNILVVVGIMLLIIVATIHRMIVGHHYTGELIFDLRETRIERSFGFMFFLMILIFAFAIPIIAFYITNALKKIKVVKNHEYIAYHAIVSSVRSGKVCIFDKNKHYDYKYCTCVGIKEKNVHLTPATLIFIPDDVLLFPDNEKYKVDRYK